MSSWGDIRKLAVVGCVVAAISCSPPTTTTTTTPYVRPTTTQKVRPPKTTTTTTTAATTTTTAATTTTVTSGGWWKPTADRPLTLHWVLEDAVDVNDPVQMGLRGIDGSVLPEPDVYDIDGEFNSASTVATLKARGKKVICYVDMGVYETYRQDAYKFPQSVIGNADSGWNGSYWLDIRQIDVLAPIMKARIDMCKQKGFDAVEPDEIDAWDNNSGFPITYDDQIRYNTAVAGWIHEAGLTAILKGDYLQVRDLHPLFDAALTEECGRWYRDPLPCTDLNIMVADNKAVWVADYRTQDITTTDCDNYRLRSINAARYKLGLPLNGGRQPCPGW